MGKRQKLPDNIALEFSRPTVPESVSEPLSLLRHFGLLHRAVGHCYAPGGTNFDEMQHCVAACAGHVNLRANVWPKAACVPGLCDKHWQRFGVSFPTFFLSQAAGVLRPLVELSIALWR